jgi:hypothetical protein
MATMVATSFAPFAVLQDALITTRISCVPTNLTATAQSPVLTCFPFNVAFAAKVVTLQVTASSSPSRSSSSRDPSHSVCPPFHNTHHNNTHHNNTHHNTQHTHHNNNTVHPPELCLKHPKQKKKNSKEHFLLFVEATAADV